MKPTRYLPEEELVERGLEALLDALGPIEAMRFLNLPRPHRLESVERHRRWQASLEQDQFYEQVFGSEAGSE
jgi:hypothetical protein